MAAPAVTWLGLTPCGVAGRVARAGDPGADIKAQWTGTATMRSPEGGLFRTRDAVTPGANKDASN
jgi:hypothetical protein